jgi:hypothetical protein
MFSSKSAMSSRLITHITYQHERSGPFQRAPGFPYEFTYVSNNTDISEEDITELWRQNALTGRISIGEVALGESRTVIS